MDYFDEAFRDLLFLIRRRRADLIFETMRAGWPIALIALAAAGVGLYQGYHHDSRYYAMTIVAMCVVPAVAWGIPLLRLTMPIHFGRAVSGTLQKIDREPAWVGHTRGAQLAFHLRETAREISVDVRYGAKIDATLGRQYLLLLHPRLESHALVLLDDDARYMSTMLRPLSRERRADVLGRAARFRDWPQNRLA